MRLESGCSGWHRLDLRSGGTSPQKNNIEHLQFVAVLSLLVGLLFWGTSLNGIGRSNKHKMVCRVEGTIFRGREVTELHDNKLHRLGPLGVH
jgi:hypothetical protein